jgi:Kef-type K+ transport system membrane component KefB
MHILYAILVLLVVTRAFGELAKRLGQPVLLGELVSGTLLGIVFTQFAASLPFLSDLENNEVFRAITDLGIFFLMLMAGMELHPRDLTKSSRSAFAVAVGGMVLPLALGMGAGWLILPESEYRVPQMLFLGVALSITAVPVSIKVLHDLNQLKTPVGSIIVSAAIFDDVLSLMLLAVLTAVIGTGAPPGLASLLGLVLKILLFFALTFVLGHFVLPWLGLRARRLHVEEFEFSFLLIVSLAFSVLAEVLGLHFILGAFMAGLFFGRDTIDREVFEDVNAKVSAVSTGFLGPLFFASIGLHLNLSAVTAIPGVLIGLIVIATIGKLVGAGGPAWLGGMSARESLAVGIGMNARGAVELVIAGIALRAGLFSTPSPPPPVVSHLFSAVVVMAVVTTLATPLLVRLLFERKGPGD